MAPIAVVSELSTNVQVGLRSLPVVAAEWKKGGSVAHFEGGGARGKSKPGQSSEVCAIGPLGL